MDEDNSLADKDPKDPAEPLSPKMGGKKLKLNDGSSHETSQETSEENLPFILSTPTSEETVPSTSTDENLDSGMSVTKSECNSTDGKSLSTAEKDWTTGPTTWIAIANKNTPLGDNETDNLDSFMSLVNSESDSTDEESLTAAELKWIGATTWKACAIESPPKIAPCTSKDETGDSGVSADKSESSNDKSAGTSAGPSNEMVNIAATGSNVRAILLNIRQPNHRNYRKRKTPEHDTDSNASSRDSDDFSAAEDTTPPRPADENSEPDAEMQRLMELCSTDTDDSNNSTSTSSSSSSSPSTPSMTNYIESFGNESDGPVRMHSGDTDTDDEAPVWTPWNLNETSQSEDRKMPDVLLKERPKHNYLILKEIINREMGLTFPHGKTAKEDVIFSNRFYGSLHSVYRLKKLHALNKHRGCVNSINFHPEGQLLVSGSDDTNIIVWDWAKNLPLQTVKTGHKSNVFQSKFLYLNAQSQLNIVTCARDGQVRLIQCPPSGGAGSRRRLVSHARAAHKLHVSALEPHTVLSAGEDGLVMHADVRTDHANRLFHVKDKGSSPIPLYSVHGHPLDPKELIVAGRDKFIRMYDRRKSTRPLAQYSPSFFEKIQSAKAKERLSLTHLTCAIYNHNGTEILGSYNDEDIYLFDTLKDVYDVDKEGDASIDGYSKRFSGHRNSATFKGVAFFGPNSDYVVSGSDCSHIYIWSKKQESIVQWMKGDVNGVVNCIEGHPKSPVLASCGLDRDVKIWIPKATEDPNYEGLEKVIRENSAKSIRSPLFNDFLPTIYSAWRSENRLAPDETPPSFGGNIEFDGNVCTTF